MANSTPQPLAIVGMACRFPGGLDSPGKLWQAILDRYSAIGPVPADRWTQQRYYSPEEAAKGKAYIQRGGFLSEDVSQFDAAFFGISPREAENMDPQQRLLLEVVWEAYENAGIPLPEQAGRPVGVYVGGFMLDHMITQMAPANRSQINQHTAAGMMMTMLSNRVSHTFDLRGPSLSIDTACSSSLVAFHYACQDLWRGECEMAVVGGANVMLRPEYPMGMCKGHFLSRDGECKSFDDRGDGYGRGEGAGIVLVKPLAAAQRDGDQILATVDATGTNQDGRTPGVSMPSGEAQAQLIQRVRDNYNLDWSDIRYVECHGTGTAIGDPTETEAIGQTYGSANRDKHPVVLGSIKSNTGHMEACAGVAGVIKAVLTLQHGIAGPLANLQTPNPKIDCDAWNVRLADQAIPLAKADESFAVAVNSFGYGGSNAHAVLRRAPLSSAQPAIPASNANGNGHSSVRSHQRATQLLPISARGEQALNAMAGKYADLLETNVSLEDVLHTASSHRAHLSHRAVIAANSRAELIERLRKTNAGEAVDGVARGDVPFTGRRDPVFVFTGMGPQWWAMGQELYQQSDCYRKTVEQADQVFQSIAGFSILAEMLLPEADSQITLTEYAQPANAVVQLGLLAMLQEAGLEPGAVVGHSVGEVASAYAAGVLTLQETMLVSYHRSRLQATTRGAGGMLAIGCNLEEAEACIQPYNGAVAIAAVNGPTNITLAGDTDALADIASALTSREVFNRQLEVEVAYHSPTMDPILDALRRELASLDPSEPRMPLYSTVTGQQVTQRAYDAEYWVRNVREPVRFSDAIVSLLDDGYSSFIEIGPHPVLATSLREIFKSAGTDARQTYTLRRNQPECENVTRAVGQAYCHGAPLDWSRHHAAASYTPLPNYPWQRDTFWMENDRGRQDRIATIDHPMLGIQEAPGAPVWRNDFDHAPVLYLRDHVVEGMPILPAAAYLESLLELAALQHEEPSGLAIRQLRILAPMLIKLERGLDSVTAFDPASGTATIRSLENGKLGEGQVHARAALSAIPATSNRHVDLEQLRSDCPEELAVEDYYQRLRGIGLEYEHAFQTIRSIRTAGEDQNPAALCHIQMQPELTHDLHLYRLHPTLLDACFQSLLALVQGSSKSFLPTDIAELCVYSQSSPAAVWCHAERRKVSESRIECDLTLLDDTGLVLATIRGMGLSEAAKRPLVDKFGDPIKRQILTYDWQYGNEVNEPKRLGHWLLVEGEADLTAQVESRLMDYGAMVTARVSPETLSDDSGEILHQVLSSAGSLDGVLVLTQGSQPQDPTAERAIRGLSQLLKTLDQQAGTRPRVYITTRGAFAVQDFDAEVFADQTAINGFARVAFNELEGFTTSTIDLPTIDDENTVDALVREVLADDLYDEVALRHTGRFISELTDSDLLERSEFEYRPLSDEQPLLVRPLNEDEESVGTACVVAAEATSPSQGEIRLRVEASVVPKEVLLDPKSKALSQPLLEVVGQVLATGPQVTEFAVGDRVAGLVPPDLASHLVVNLSAAALAPISADANAVDLVASLGLAARMEAAANDLRLRQGACALVDHGPAGDALAKTLELRGVTVTRLTPASETIDSHADFERSAEGIAEAVTLATRGIGFDVLAADLSQWCQTFDQRSVTTGGAVVDLAEHSTPLTLAPNVGTLVRTDLPTLLQRGTLSHAVGNATSDLQDGTLTPTACLDVSLNDMAWQKLPLADAQATLVITYDTNDTDLPVVRRHALQFRGDATYLVTGGFGGLGQKTVQWLIDNGARHLVLTGRAGANSPDKVAFLQHLAEQGVEAKAVACDTADVERVQQVLSVIASGMPPLRGIFHSGAVIEDQPITEIEDQALARVMQSKATGAWNLHQATAGLELDHFVMYSSVANLVGNSRQSVYSAANGFLNGLAHQRRLAGKPGLAVCWGAIADVGVVARDEKLEQFLRYTGLRGIASDEGLAILQEALARQATQFGVTMITSWADWARFETRGAKSPRFASLIAADSAGQDSSVRDALVEELQNLSKPDQAELVASLIVEILAEVLKADPSSISIDRAISQLGIDSLMATDIQMMLDSRLGINVPVLQLIGETTTRELAISTVDDLLGVTAEPALSPA